MRKLILWICSIALLAIIALQIYAQFSPSQNTIPLQFPLEKYLPPGNWSKLPLGNNQRETNTVLKLLNFDDAIYVQAHNMDIYIAYWKPGKMPYDLVGFHAPDVCWIEAGWQKFDDGVFIKNGVVKYVKFWHIIGNQLANYNHLGYNKGFRARTQRYWNKFTDIFKHGLASHKDQLVIRVDSLAPLDSNHMYDELIRNLNDIIELSK